MTRERLEHMLTAELHRISNELAQLAAKCTDLGYGPWDPPLSSKEKKIIERFLLSCSLFQPDPAVRAASWGTRGPSEFLQAIEVTLKKLRRAGP